MTLKRWPVIFSNRDLSYGIFSIRTDRARSPRTQEEHDFYILETAPWVNVIPLTPDQEVVMIRQYRHGVQDFTLEIPGGLVEPGDTLSEAAARELSEETGYRAETMTELGYVHPNPAIQDNRCYSFVAEGVQKVGEQSLDEKEDIEILLQPLSAIPSLIRNRAITHALVVAAFARLFMERDIHAST